MGLALSGFEPAPLVEEIRARVVEELDYANEARNQQLFADFYRGHPFIHVPDVLMPLSTPRVLTTELAEGVRFEEMSTWDQDERNQAAEAIYRFVFRSLYRLQAFNGDPHPGNYLFRPGGQVTFLDFGLVKHFTPAEIDLFGDMIRAMVNDRDTARYREIVERIGMLRPGAPVSDRQVHDYFSHFYDFVMHDDEVTITPQWSTDALARYFDPTGPYGPYAYGLSGFSNVLDEFKGGDGVIGIHGTNEPGAIGTDVSHGCIRLRNEAILELVPVLPLGTPVHITA